MTRKIRRVGLVVAVMLVALLVNLTLQQVVRAQDYRDSPGNQRQLLEEYSRERGSIIVENSAVANSVRTNDALEWLRQYAQGPVYAAATGYYSLVYGASGLERTENAILAGTDDRFFVDRLQQLFGGRAPRGGSIRLTLDNAAQQAAYAGLAGRTGAVVAINPRTGAILAFATSPSFDPDELSSHDPSAIRKAYERLSADPQRPLLNRPAVMTLPPGSTFKIVTAAAALENGISPDEQLFGGAELDLPQTDRTLRNYDDQPCTPEGTATLAQAMIRSCNTTYASVGLTLGDDVLRAQAEKFGFNENFDIPLRAAASVFPDDLNPPQTAQSAIGQFDVRATALQMAMVMAAVANGGEVLRPYLVQQVLAPDLSVLENQQPEVYDRAMSPQNATLLQDMLVDVVEIGTGSNARIPGVRVGGKTGTAQSGANRAAHAWFVGAAPLPDPQVAVAVVLQNGGGAAEVSGNRLAAPIARSVIEAVLGRS